MKKILLSVAVAFGVFSTTYAQEVHLCQTDQKTLEYVESLSPQEKVLYELDQQAHALEVENYISNHPELLSSSNARGTITYTIPVVFHIIHQGGPENISDEQVLNALNHMNEDYQKSNSNWSNVKSEFLSRVADVEIEFKLAKKDNAGNCTNGITRTYSSVTDGGNGAQRIAAVQAQHGNWPGNKYMNIFIFKTMDVEGAAGYTYRPSTWGWNSMDNGIHLVHNYVGSIGTAGSSGAHTLTHEAGHWLDLPHPWGGTNNPGLAGNCSSDDGIADTPNTIGWQSCTLNGESCGSLDNVENFMEYSYCSKMFTNGQKARMHAALSVSSTGRSNVHSAANLTATGVNLPDVLCEAEFDADYKVVCQGQAVNFQDMSYNNVTGWNWSFTGGSPSSSTIENPTIVYNSPGTYSVTLSANDGSSTETKTKTAFIKVLEAGVSLPFIEGFEGFTSLSNSTWRVENPGNNAKFEVVTNVGYTGSNSVKLSNFGQTSGNTDAFVSSPIDLSSITSQVTLSFRYAYRKRSAGNNEALKVLITSTCGETWAQRKTLTGSAFGNATASSSWTPSSANDWVTVHMPNVTSTFWVDNFMVKFEFDSDNGNNLYIDDINIYSGPEIDIPLGINDNEIINYFNVYPNPADHIANVSFTVQGNQQANVTLVNMMGQNIQSNVIQASEGENLVMLNTENVEAGVYFVKVNIGGVQQTKRLIIQ